MHLAVTHCPYSSITAIPLARNHIWLFLAVRNKSSRSKGCEYLMILSIACTHRLAVLRFKKAYRFFDASALRYPAVQKCRRLHGKGNRHAFYVDLPAADFGYLDGFFKQEIVAVGL